MSNKGKGVEIRATTLRIKFFINGEMFRETLKMNPTPANVKYAAKLKQEIDSKIGFGLFNYAEYFPDSPNLKRLGLAKGKPTFREYAELWHSTNGTLSKGTRIQYRRYLNAVWLPLYGDRIIAEIKHSELKAMIGERDWGSAKNMNNHLIALRGPFELAVRDKVIGRDDNPMDGIENKVSKPSGPDPFSIAEINMILDDMYKHYPESIGNFFETAFFTGLRPQEQIALRWTDIDWPLETIHINKAFSYGEEKSTKTGVARDVELISRALEAIKRQKKFTFLKGEHVFVNHRTGNPYPSSQQLRDNYLKSALKRTGIRGRDMYQTRHSFATLNLMAGANVAWLAKTLGHNVVMLLSTYAKWVDRADKGREKNKLEQQLNEVVKETKCVN